jgi:adenosylhomocysteine nucleosidase
MQRRRNRRPFVDQSHAFVAPVDRPERSFGPGGEGTLPLTAARCTPDAPCARFTQPPPILAVHAQREHQKVRDGNIVSELYQNIARDQARVGAQIGHIRGNVSLGPGITETDRDARTELQQILDELRLELQTTRARSGIDHATADAAEQELDEAADCLPLADHDSTSRFIIALKRMSGLVGGVVSLGAKVTEAITAVQGMK